MAVAVDFVVDLVRMTVVVTVGADIVESASNVAANKGCPSAASASSGLLDPNTTVAMADRGARILI